MGLFKTWIEAADETEFQSTDRRQVRLPKGRAVTIFRVDGQYFAVASFCSHARATMIGGILDGHTIECPMHGARFDVRTGMNLSPPAVRPIERYDTKVEAGKVWVKV